ncbi:ABC transporter ATP-binding protein/permease [Candidatus Pelagibacter ubique]|nr:ABC transporter ATP-binding protein/permease [Candidatus Pelagibacter ubique]
MTQLKNLFIILFELIDLVKNYKKKYLFLLFILFTILSSFFEILTIGSLIPLMQVLLDPIVFFENTDIFIKKFFSINNSDDLTGAILIAFSVLIIISYLAKILLIWMSTIFTFDLSKYLSNKIFIKTLSKKYKYFTNSSTSLMLSNQEKVEHVRGVIFSFTQLISSIIISTSIFIFLFYIDFKTAFLITIFSVISYFLLFIKLRKKLNFLSKENSELLDQRFKILIEASENIKEIKLRSLYDFFIKKYAKINTRIKKIKILTVLIHSFPSQIFLMVGTIFIIILMYYYSTGDNSLVENIPFLSALIFGIQKVFPQAQNVFNSLAGIKEYRKSLIDIKYINEDDEAYINVEKKINEEILIKKYFELKNINFQHENSNQALFKNANLKFEVGKIYGIKGISGAGKTTVIDIICGLLSSQGELVVDGENIDFYNNNLWQNNIAYLSQNNILADSNIIENIAYGIDESKVDFKKIENASIKANIFEFITNMKDSFYSSIGEKGIKISGGQSQRILLAKIFYLDKKILILDESTNALDKRNEEMIFKSLREHSKNKITIIINHNLSIEKYLDHIYEVKDKKINLIK